LVTELLSLVLKDGEPTGKILLITVLLLVRTITFVSFASLITFVLNVESAFKEGNFYIILPLLSVEYFFFVGFFFNF